VEINPKTAGVFLRRFTLGHIRQFDQALGQVHRRAFDLLCNGTVDKRDPDFHR